MDGRGGSQTYFDRSSHGYILNISHVANEKGAPQHFGYLQNGVVIGAIKSYSQGNVKY